MELTEREIRYLQKIIENDSDLDLEVIVSTINQKRDENSKVDISLVLSKLESLSSPEEEKEKSQVKKTTPDSKESISKYAGRAMELEAHQNLEEAIDKTAYSTHKILTELEPAIHHLLLPKKPKDYVILSGKTQAYLSQEVNKYLKRGWQPLGGVSAAAFGVSPVAGNQYIQAMVIY